MKAVTEKKKYVYFYPENKAIGDQIPNTSGFITKVLLRNKYVQGYVNDVMKGRRNNTEILDAMKQVAELSKVENY